MQRGFIPSQAGVPCARFPRIAGAHHWSRRRQRHVCCVGPLNSLNGDGGGHNGRGPPTGGGKEGGGQGEGSWSSHNGPFLPFLACAVLAGGAAGYSAVEGKLRKFPAATVSVIIPVLNESVCIRRTLDIVNSLNPPVHEIIVVDGGSSDDTVKQAETEGATVLRSGRGRAVQQNAGAAAAQGELLCFLHADTQPPSDLVTIMRQELSRPDTVLLGFVPRIEHEGRVLWFFSLHNFLSTYYAPLLFRPLSFVRGLRLLFGDQTLCCRKKDFTAVGGFARDLPIMEDADLCLRLHQAGPAAVQGERPGRIKMILNRVSTTSGRRLAAWGPWKGTVIHFKLAWKWFLGGSGEELRQLYDTEYTDLLR